jgi:tetratricopeptide (TPR) repeat protein
MKRGLRGFALVVVVALCSSAAAQSEGEPAAQAEGEGGRSYEIAIRDGLEEYRRGNWEEARALFKHAHKLQPSARTLRGLGMACFEAKRYVEAIDALKAALEDKRKPLTGELRDKARRILERAERYVGRVDLEVEPRSARVAVDGFERRIVGGSIYVDPGQRELRVSADGYRIEVRSVAVDSGENVRIALTLRREETAPAPGAGEDAASGSHAMAETTDLVQESDSGADSDGSKVLPWVIVGGSGAVAVTGAVLFGLGMNDISEVEDPERGTYYDEIEAAEKRAPVFTGVGVTLFGLGVAGVVTGLVLLVLDNEQEKGAAGLSLVPGGVVVRGVL